jgi:rSAM/selenodomain-associated transferase 1
VSSDRAETIVVLAKEPRPGRVKTRLQARFSPEQAAALAAAALSDTLAAVRACRVRRRVLAWDGDPTGWDRGFEVVAQPDGKLGARLASAFSAVQTARPGEPTLLIGMDTPQIEPSLLEHRWGRADAVLGLSDDGGFWAIGLRDVDPYDVFDGIEMSTSRTGATQLARLLDLGLSVQLLPPLRDVDEPADAELVAERHPQLRFSRQYQSLVAECREQPVGRLFDGLYAGSAIRSRSTAVGGGGLVMDVPRWNSPADMVDQIVVSRCEPPVIDVGCGPGRMVRALQHAGRAVLGIDISSVAVEVGSGGGGQVLRRHLADPLPGEGRWGTALLLDGNVGIGGDIPGLLCRCQDLVGPGGLIICEVDSDPERHEAYHVVLSDGRGRSVAIPWASIGGRALQRLAAGLDLITAEEWCADHRVFLALRTAS